MNSRAFAAAGLVLAGFVTAITAGLFVTAVGIVRGRIS